MSIAHLSVPNFRIPKRLVSWMQENGVRERVFSAEKVFFKENIAVATRAWGLVGYAKLVGRLPSEMERIVACHPLACIGYAESIPRSSVPDEVINACGEDVNLVIRMVGVLGRRIPQFENKIVNPSQYVDYVTQVRTRIPEMEERILFSDSFPAAELAEAAKTLVERLDGHSYGSISKESPIRDPRIKELIKGDCDATASYMNFLSQHGMKLDPEFYPVFAGHGDKLSKLSEHLRSRLPMDLELTWKGSPRELVQYAIRRIGGRLPEDLESVLLGDEKAASDYAFQVVRGFSSPRLSDRLHTFMVMKSFENPENTEIKRYISECDRVAEYERTMAAE